MISYDHYEYFNWEWIPRWCNNVPEETAHQSLQKAFGINCATLLEIEPRWHFYDHREEFFITIIKMSLFS